MGFITSSREKFWERLFLEKNEKRISNLQGIQNNGSKLHHWIFEDILSNRFLGFASSRLKLRLIPRGAFFLKQRKRLVIVEKLLSKNITQ